MIDTDISDGTCYRHEDGTVTVEMRGDGRFIRVADELAAQVAVDGPHGDEITLDTAGEYRYRYSYRDDPASAVFERVTDG